MIDMEKLKKWYESIHSQADHSRTGDPELSSALHSMAVVVGLFSDAFGPGELDPVGHHGGDFETTLDGCARCGGHHRNITFVKFKEPVLGMTHWGACPETGEPILNQVVQKGDYPKEPKWRDVMRRAWADGFRAAVDQARGVVTKRMADSFTRHWGQNVVNPEITNLLSDVVNMSYRYASEHDSEDEGFKVRPGSDEGEPGEDPEPTQAEIDERPSWDCPGCGQTNSGWTGECGRCCKHRP